jgi:polysaccharide deacetylase family protein (PEP-CTERM system associated)
MLNAMTVDVEDGWSIYSRDTLLREIEPTDTVVIDTERILEILSVKKVKGTFFVVGNVAAKFPSLIKSIANEGHELGIHGYSHKRIFLLSKYEFRNEVKRAKCVLEDLTSAEVVGHRAPAFSIAPETKWALQVLAEEGFMYDSSIVPCKNPQYGWKDFGKDICRIDLGDGMNIVEVPMTVMPIPMTSKGFITGGGYLRHFPYFVSYAAIKHIQKTRPVVLYMHPYEFGKEVVETPMRHLSVVSRWRAIGRLRMGVGNRRTMPAKVQKLLSAFEFGPVRSVIEQWLG